MKVISSDLSMKSSKQPLSELKSQGGISKQKIRSEMLSLYGSRPQTRNGNNEKINSSSGAQKIMKASKSQADGLKLAQKSRNVESALIGSSMQPQRSFSPSSTKIAKEFIHSGLGYSPSRRGMLVVPNNAVGLKPIPCDKPRMQISLSTKSLGTSVFQSKSTVNLDKNKILSEAMKH